MTEKLTPRQEDVLRLIVTGKTYADIAAALDVTLDTVKLHVAALRKKLNRRTKVELALYAVTRFGSENACGS